MGIISGGLQALLATLPELVTCFRNTVNAETICHSTENCSPQLFCRMFHAGAIDAVGEGVAAIAIALVRPADATAGAGPRWLIFCRVFHCFT